MNFSYFIRLPELVRADAFIQVNPVPLVITAPVPGKLTPLVRDGQRVTKGSTLFIVSHTPVRSPSNGSIVFLETRDSTHTGDTLMAVIDTGGPTPTYYAALHLRVEDAGKILPGQEVGFILPAFPVQRFGTLRGKVESLSPLPMDGKYLIKVALPQGLITDTRFHLDNFTYLSGTADIVIKSRSLLERIFKKS